METIHTMLVISAIVTASSMVCLFVLHHQDRLETRLGENSLTSLMISGGITMTLGTIALLNSLINFLTK